MSESQTTHDADNWRIQCTESPIGDTLVAVIGTASFSSTTVSGQHKVTIGPHPVVEESTLDGEASKAFVEIVTCQGEGQSSLIVGKPWIFHPKLDTTFYLDPSLKDNTNGTSVSDLVKRINKDMDDADAGRFVLTSVRVAKLPHFTTIARPTVASMGIGIHPSTSGSTSQLYSDAAVAFGFEHRRNDDWTIVEISYHGGEATAWSLYHPNTSVSTEKNHGMRTIILSFSPKPFTGPVLWGSTESEGSKSDDPESKRCESIPINSSTFNMEAYPVTAEKLARIERSRMGKFKLVSVGLQEGENYVRESGASSEEKTWCHERGLEAAWELRLEPSD